MANFSSGGCPVNKQIGKVSRPEGVTRWLDASSGVHHRLALGNNGELYGWDYSAPFPAREVRPANVRYWKRISAGYGLSAAIGSDDQLYIWQSAGSQPAPVPVPKSVRKWVSMAAGTGVVLMIGDDCRLYAWGDNTWGQLGTETGNLTVPALGLVPHFINTTTFAARDFRPRRGASDAHTLSRHVGIRREQRRLGRKEPPPAGLRRFSVLALLLLGHPDRSGRGMLPRRA